MPTRKAYGNWKGGLKDGRGHVKTETQILDNDFHFNSRFGDGTGGTNPEELIGAAHAGCFSMALSAGLEQAGYPAEEINTDAHVTEDQVEGGFKITKIELNTEAKIPGIDEQTFQEQAEGAKKNCPVSQALSGADITLNAKLKV